MLEGAQHQAIDPAFQVAGNVTQRLARVNGFATLVEKVACGVRETNALLKVRLRAAALFLFLALGAFLVRRLLFGGDPLWPLEAAVVTALGAALLTKTCLRCNCPSPRQAQACRHCGNRLA